MLDINKEMAKCVQYSNEYGKAFEEGDAKVTNRLQKRCVKQLKKMSEIFDEGNQVLISLLNNKSIYVRFATASYLIEIDKEKALSMLKELSYEDRIIGTTSKLLISYYTKEEFI
jgi:hypothetical protein